MPETLAPDPQLLLAHADWVRALARRLVGDQAEADDLAQDTWVAALRSPPATTLNLRGWLARVVRNAFLQNRRGVLRRVRREALAAPAEALPSAADLVERASAHRELVTAVLALAEPYRTTVLLRWFEGLPPRQVAQRMAVPVATVRTRLTRAHAELRAVLTREHRGEAQAWMALLLPSPGWLEPAALAGGVMLVKKVPLVLAASLVLAATIAFWPGVSTADQGAGRAGAAPQVAADAGPSGGDSGMRPEAGAGQRQRVADPAPATATPPAATATVRGRVLREDGASAPGVGIGWGGTRDAATGLAISDAEGRFQFTTPPRQGELVAAEPRWATLLAGLVSGPASTVEPVVVVAPAIALGGVVVDPEGGLLAEAVVTVRLPAGFRARLRAVLDWSSDQTVRVATDAQGRFHMPRVAQLADARLVAWRDGFLASDLPLPAGPDPALRIVLERPRLQEGAVRGQVVAADGAPVPGAWVSLGLASTRADGAGVFELQKGKGGADHRLLAVSPGFLPATREIERDPARPTEFVVLRLSGKPLAIQGSVVDEAGAPIAGAKVWVTDPTVFGQIDGGPATVEGLAAAGKTRKDLELLMAQGGNAREIMTNTPTVMFSFTLSGADGRFELGGLTDRDYTLVAMDPATLLRAMAGPMRAGQTGVQMVLPASGCFAKVAGKVVSRTGAPIPGVRMVAMTDTISIRLSENSASTNHAQALVSTVTDAEGRFELTRVPRTAAYLRLDGDRILPLEYGRRVAGGLEELAGRAIEDMRIEVRLRMHLRVELADAASADSLAVLDEAGSQQMINSFEGQSRRTTQRAEVREGKTGTLAVPDVATTLVLYRGDVEVRRVPLQMVPDQLNVLRL